MRFYRLRTGLGASWAREEGERLRLLDGDPFSGASDRAHTVPVGEAELLAPATPSKIVAIGLNYREHATEMGAPIPDEPRIFLKPTTAIIGPDDPIVLPPQSTRVEHEAELAVVVKKRCRNVPAERVRDYVLGYTCLNDVTARDIQARDRGPTRAKAFDTFCPLGPCIATDIEPNAVTVEAFVNGIVRQSGSTKDFVFPVDDIVARIAEVMTLLPGDVIATGTPAGVGPLTAGDRVEIRIDGVGSLKNPVVKL
jgi:2-keto-4-pentenoate hydratase/2-oxohepta-3-ene-1,7-dioic acid hydratase in catechol pathway